MKKLIIALSLACELQALAATGGAGFYNDTDTTNSLTVSYSISSYDFNTNHSWTLTAAPHVGASVTLIDHYTTNASAHYTVSLSAGDYPLTCPSITNASQPMTAGGSVMAVTLPSTNNWQGSPGLSQSTTGDNAPNAIITIHSVTPPPGQAGNTAQNNKTARPICPKIKDTENPTKGMADYTFHTLLTSLHVTDTPLAYSPPVGPSVEFSPSYNQKEAYQPTNWTYFNLGPKWVMNCQSFIQDDPTAPNADVRYFPPGGGSEAFTGFNPATGQYGLGLYSQSLLVKTSTNSYELRFNDGSKQVYAYVGGSSPRCVFLTQSVDASGNSVNYNYETITNGWVRLKTIVDASSQTNTFAYGLTNDVLKIVTAQVDFAP